MIRHGDGILFDTAYVEPDVWLWVRLDNGQLISVRTPNVPLFYLAGPRRVVEAAAERLAGSDIVTPDKWTERIEFWSGEQIPVLAVKVLKPQQVTGLARRLLHQDHRLRAYDIDIDPCLSFHSRNNLFPLARVAVSWDESEIASTLRSIRALDDPWDPQYRVPDFRMMGFRLSRSPLIPLGKGNSLIVSVGQEKHELQPEGGALAIQQLNALVADHDPDVIGSERGDQIIFPWLLETSAKCGVPLKLDRLAPTFRRQIKCDGKTLWVYSGVMYQAPDYPLLGRWHLDLGNSFFGDKAGIEGVIEMSRLSRLPIQRQARRSGGNAITSMEIHLALQRRILVPFVKDQLERVRTAAELLAADKGPLTYFPPIGIWEQVIEFDFHQMYPSIMAVHNVSPETMNCACCIGKRPVPGTSHHTCTRKRGLVPDALEGLLKKRLGYKALLKECTPEERPRYEARATALKWTLVTTFGYQGFHNAKFGLIAAHEAITAWGRESLLIAKETFEEAGYRLLHALTDSVYVVKAGWTQEEVTRLVREVERRTGLTLGIEGVYDWLCFLPSKTHAGMSVATRYFGKFSHGEMKVRGIKVRQHGTPRFLQGAQQRFLSVMARCRSRKELQAAVWALDAIYRQYSALLWRNLVRPEDLLITAQVSRTVEAYRSNSAVAICLRTLAERGIRIAPGLNIQYVIVARKHPNPRERYVPDPLLDRVRYYDATAYEDLLSDAYKEVVGLLVPPDSNEASRSCTLFGS